METIFHREDLGPSCFSESSSGDREVEDRIDANMEEKVEPASWVLRESEGQLQAGGEEKVQCVWE